MKANHTRPLGAQPCVRSLLIDNYDSYTYNLYQLLSLVNGCEAVVVRNDARWEDLCALEFDNIVISPGPGRPDVERDFGVCAKVLAEARVPVLGVCLGHQGIALQYGARIARDEQIFHGRRSRIFHADHPLFAGVPQGFWAVRYHSLLAVEPIPPQLSVIAWTKERSVMALAARSRLLYGVQFHPESWMTEYGAKILENFRDITWNAMLASAVSTSARSGVLGMIEERETGVRAASELAETTSSATKCALAHEPRSDDASADSGTPREVWAVVERFSGMIDARALFPQVRGETPIAWLDSVRRGVDTGRFSYIAWGEGSLAEVVRYDQARRTCAVTRKGTTTLLPELGVFTYLSARHRSHKLIFPPEFPQGFPFGFCGGYVGWIGYECKAECGSPTAHTLPTDDAAFFFADRMIILDHDCDEVYLFALVPDDERSAADGWMEAMRALLANLRARKTAEEPPASKVIATARPLHSKARYLENILRCQEVLARGDSYQVCLSTHFSVESDSDPFAIYRRLRHANPASYAAYLDFGRTQIVCASPERFLRVTKGGVVEAKPIKGTSARDVDPLRDAQLAFELSRNVKETAENLMIVDLLRNDLGRVCTVGSVHVPSLMAIESLETLHQMVSTIRGELRAGMNAVDCLRACFPSGSMTGAPKLRAMGVIEELEGVGRGIYSGALGYLSVDGAAEFNVVIRTLVYHEGTIDLGAGGGITVLSDGEAEWEEVLLKARSVLNALNAEIKV